MVRKHEFYNIFEISSNYQIYFLSQFKYVLCNNTNENSLQDCIRLILKKVRSLSILVVEIYNSYIIKLRIIVYIRPQTLKHKSILQWLTGLVEYFFFFFHLLSLFRLLIKLWRFLINWLIYILSKLVKSWYRKLNSC